VSDPNYSHEFVPNKKGLCKQIVSGSLCHQGEQALVHTRWALAHKEEEERINSQFDELKEIKQKAEYLNRRTSESSENWVLADITELIIRLADELVKEKQNRLSGEQS